MWRGQSVAATKKIIKMKSLWALKAQTAASACLFTTRCRATLFLLHTSFLQKLTITHSVMCRDSRAYEICKSLLCNSKKTDIITENIFPPVSVMHGCVIWSDLVIACYWCSVETQPGGYIHKCKYCREASLRSQSRRTQRSHKPHTRNIEIRALLYDASGGEMLVFSGRFL